MKQKQKQPPSPILVVPRSILLFLISYATCTFGWGQPLDKYQKDREAILAMAGDYEVDFQFIETVAIDQSYELKKPYLEDAAEVVFIVEDSPERIVLQHVLWVESYDRVVKHWKQEWRYEDQVMYEFVGDLTWQRRQLSKEEVKGTWSQKVSQVDDSPRYESYGKWVHQGGLSSWQGLYSKGLLSDRWPQKRSTHKQGLSYFEPQTQTQWDQVRDSQSKPWFDAILRAPNAHPLVYMDTSKGNRVYHVMAQPQKKELLLNWLQQHAAFAPSYHAHTKRRSIR